MLQVEMAYTGIGGGFNLEPLPKGDAGIDRTLERLVDSVRASVHDPGFLQAARLATVSGGRTDSLEVLAGVVRYVRSHWIFRRDPYKVELAATPAYMMGRIHKDGVYVGDCDEAAVLIAAILNAVGYRTQFTVIQRDPKNESYDHIFVEAYTPKGWAALDGVAFGQGLFFRPLGVREKSYPV